MTLEILSSGALAPRHGFFTRRGGASSGIFAGLNCGEGSSDLAEAVTLNRARVAGAMGVRPERLVTVHQVHSANVATIEAPPQGARPRADAIVTSHPGIAIAVLTADCAPVLLADAEAGVVGAAHAGWRGALGGVLGNVVDAMVSLGADRESIAAVVGPTISQTAYEVGPEFLDTFLADDPHNGRFFAGGAGDRVHFDLPGYVLHRLREAGVGHAEWIRMCTFSDPERFYSYRRARREGNADYGRLISAIVL
ncbi:MAG: peptidoglycan editing factor PgeF [Alphaproteobacteria bacterium]|nr:MAG: peptidoglycan editing factor PgeF [Alphaproteobacteria bacterium]